MKGSKRNLWLKECKRISRKWNKRMWNRKVRYSEVTNNCHYKRLAGNSMYDAEL